MSPAVTPPVSLRLHLRCRECQRDMADVVERPPAPRTDDAAVRVILRTYAFECPSCGGGQGTIIGHTRESHDARPRA